MESTNSETFREFLEEIRRDRPRCGPYSWSLTTPPTTAEDYEERKNWDKNMEAYEQVLGRCSTPWAPWYVVPADDKWYRNWVVGKIITDTLKDMDPKIPDASDQIHEFLDKM